jgi:hypothetical protein
LAHLLLSDKIDLVVEKHTGDDEDPRESADADQDQHEEGKDNQGSKGS